MWNAEVDASESLEEEEEEAKLLQQINDASPSKDPLVIYSTVDVSICCLT